MKIKNWFFALLMGFSVVLSAQNDTQMAAVEKIEETAQRTTIYYEKEVYIHRYVLEGKVDIEVKTSGPAMFTLLNEGREELQGYELTLPSNTIHTMSFTNLPKGKYYVRVKKGNQSFVRKVSYE